MPTLRSLRDGLINVLSGIGSVADPRTHARYLPTYMDDAAIAAAYSGSWLMRKIVDKPSREMTREWRDWQADARQIGAIEAEEKRLGIRAKVEEAIRLAGLGGAGMVLYVDGDDQTQPLDPARIRRGGLTAVHVWHRSKFSLGQMIDAWGDPWFGHPAHFEVALSNGTPTRFHPSRVVTFRGDYRPDIMGVSWQDAYWGVSRVQTVIDAVTNSDTAQAGFAALIKDARNRRLYMPGLLELCATAEGEDRMRRRAQAIAMGESSLAVTFLDAGNGEKGGEKLEDRQMNWTGIPDLAMMFVQVAAAAADMPATVLLGKSPDGQNATGQSDLANWHATVKGRQDLDLRPRMDHLDLALIPSALGAPDSSIWWKFAPLSTPTEAEETKTLLDFATAVDKLDQTGLVPKLALEKGTQARIVESGWFPSIDAALEEMPDDERYPSMLAASPDPNADLPKGGDPLSPLDPGADGSGSGGRAGVTA